MRKKILLLLATLAVATTLGRETSAVPTSSDQTAKSAFDLPANDDAGLTFLPPTTGGHVAFLPPTTGGKVAFLPPTTGGKVAFSREKAMLAGEPEASDITAKFAMLPLGAETGRHIRNLSEDRASDPKSDTAKSESTTPIAQFTRNLSTVYAMLPLGSEAGRHIRNLDQDIRQPEKTVAANTPKATA